MTLFYSKLPVEIIKKASIAAEKAKVMEERVPAFPDVDSLDEEALKQLCRDLHGMTHPRHDVIITSFFSNV